MQNIIMSIFAFSGAIRYLLLGIVTFIVIIHLLCLIYYELKVIYFLKNTSKISTSNDLEHFKALISEQMDVIPYFKKLGFFYIVVISLLLAVRNFMDSFYILGLFLLLIIISRFFKKYEKKAGNLPVTDDSLKQEYEKIAYKWLFKDF